AEAKQLLGQAGCEQYPGRFAFPSCLESVVQDPFAERAPALLRGLRGSLYRVGSVNAMQGSGTRRGPPWDDRKARGDDKQPVRRTPRRRRTCQIVGLLVHELALETCS